tara:strand:- start:1 stop:510 length:510 start_codon:yes stop_codon:yes gene_type:complete
MAGLLNIPEGFSSWDEYDQYMKATAPSMRKSYPGLITEFVATHPITKFLVPGAEQFLQKGGTPSAFDVGFGLLDTALPAVPVAGIAKKALKSRGKTREEVSIQGGPLNTRLNEQEVSQILDDHGMDWRYHDNGGVSAKEYYTENGRLKFKWKYFKDGTALRTIRNWLGY